MDPALWIELARFYVGHFKSVRLLSGEWIHQAKVINSRLLYRFTRRCIGFSTKKNQDKTQYIPIQNHINHMKEKKIWFGNRGYGNYDGRLTVLPLRWQLFIVRLSGLSWIVSFSRRTFSSFVSYISNSFLL